MTSFLAFWLWIVFAVSLSVLLMFLIITISKHIYRIETIKRLRRNSNLPEEKK